MRCASCGFPLSPARINCSRCGAEVAGKAEKRKNAAEAMQASPQGGFSPLEGQADLERAQPQWNQMASATWNPHAPAEPQWDQTPSAIWNPDGPTDGRSDIALHSQANNGVYGQQSFSSLNTAAFADQLPFPGNEIVPSATIRTAEPEAQQPFVLSATPQVATSPPPSSNTPLPTTGWKPDTPLHNGFSSIELNPSSLMSRERSSFLASKLTPRFGFTISGAFILTGMLLLIFVFLMSLSLQLSSSLTSSQTTRLQPTTSAQNTPTTTQTVVPDPTISPTADASVGKQFIDNVQTASAVNTSTATAIQVATSFKVHQQIYVTFAVHASQSGTICLLWFLNGKQFDHFEFAMDSVSTSAYSYTTASTPGPGYIQIYWATRPDCSDKVLAQQTNFTVTP